MKTDLNMHVRGGEHTLLALLPDVRGGALAGEVSIQVSAHAPILTGLLGTVVHIWGENQDYF